MIRILLSTRLGERRWSQADLARATGIRPSTINDLYHEIAERVNLEHLDLICEALGCELSDLMIREENKETRVKTRTGADREVIFYPDGTNERIWAIDQGRRIQPVVGAVYTNRGGGRFRCIAPADNGPMFWNAAGGCSNASGVFQNIESGWTFMAKGVIQYIDGSIEWDHSTDGRFEQI